MDPKLNKLEEEFLLDLAKRFLKLYQIDSYEMLEAQGPPGNRICWIMNIDTITLEPVVECKSDKPVDEDFKKERMAALKGDFLKRIALKVINSIGATVISKIVRCPFCGYESMVVKMYGGKGYIYMNCFKCGQQME